MRDIGFLYFCCPEVFEICMLELAETCFPIKEDVDDDRCIGCMVNRLSNDN